MNIRDSLWTYEKIYESMRKYAYLWILISGYQWSEYFLNFLSYRDQIFLWKCSDKEYKTFYPSCPVHLFLVFYPYGQGIWIREGWECRILHKVSTSENNLMCIILRKKETWIYIIELKYHLSIKHEPV